MKLVRESLFSSVVRSFCIAFFSVIGIVLAFFIVMLVFGSNKTAKSMETSTYDAIIPNTNGRKYAFTSHKPLILQINITSTIGTPQGATAEGIRSILNESRMGPFKNNPIKGIFLYINSGGGTAVDSEAIFLALKEYGQKYQIPIYAYAEGFCASGAMQIACAANKIYSSETSLIGSVGVLAMYFNFSEGMEKVGVQNKTITAGTGKAAMNPFQPWTPESDANIKEIIAENYKTFVKDVSSSRPKLTEELLINKYGASVYSAAQAEEYGYIDGAGYQYEDVVQMLAQAAELENYQMIQLQPKMSFKDFLFMSNTMLKNQNFSSKNPLYFITPSHFKLMHQYITSETQLQ